MPAPERNGNDVDLSNRPFNGVFGTTHCLGSQFNLIIHGPRRGFTAAQLRGIALLLSRCSDRPTAHVTAQGAVDLGAIGARWRSIINAALVDLHLTDDDADDDFEPPQIPTRFCTYPFAGTDISVDQLLRLASVMVEHSVDHVLFGFQRIARFDITHDTSVAELHKAIRALDFLQDGQMVCTQ